MSTVDHVLAACGQLRTTWRWLATTATPGNARRNQRQPSPAGIAARNKQAAAERADRHAILTSGRVPTGQTTAPVNVAAIDARTHISNDVDDLAWQMASHLRNRVDVPFRAGQPAYRPNGNNADSRFRAAIDWVSLNAPRVTDGKVLNSAYTRLLDCDRLGQQVTGNTRQRRHLAAECAACGRRSLEWDTGSDDPLEWFITCSNPRCTCAGRDCPCKVPERVAGSRHIWIEAGWERLASHLDQRDSA